MLTHVLTHPVKTGRPLLSAQLSAVSLQLGAAKKKTNIKGKKFRLSFRQKAESLQPMVQSFKPYSCLLTADR
jgi:hypothetical protein